MFIVTLTSMVSGTSETYLYGFDTKREAMEFYEGETDEYDCFLFQQDGHTFHRLDVEAVRFNLARGIES